MTKTVTAMRIASGKREIEVLAEGQIGFFRSVRRGTKAIGS